MPKVTQQEGNTTGIRSRVCRPRHPPTPLHGARAAHLARGELSVCVSGEPRCTGRERPPRSQRFPAGNLEVTDPPSSLGKLERRWKADGCPPSVCSPLPPLRAGQERDEDDGHLGTAPSAISPEGCRVGKHRNGAPGAARGFHMFVLLSAQGSRVTASGASLSWSGAGKTHHPATVGTSQESSDVPGHQRAL